MKVRDLIEQEICVDVFDDVCEELYIAMGGPICLTEDGEKKFSEVLDFGVKLHSNGQDIVGIVNVDDEEGKWQKKLKKAKHFFESAAGYCSASDYKKWFKE